MAGSRIILSWNQPNPNISGYEITRTTPGIAPALVGSPGKSANSWIDNNTLPGQRYIYTLTAKAGDNSSKVVDVDIVRPYVQAEIETSLSSTNYNSATFKLSIVDDGGGLTEAGIVYSTQNNPVLNNGTKAIFVLNGNQTEVKISGLQANKNYYARAYAINPAGISYGNSVLIHLKLNIPGPEITDIDGNKYKSVQIGSQIWMTENLKVTKFRDGSPIPYVASESAWVNMTTGAYSFFRNSTINGSIYGPLYNFYAVIDERKLCPTGWHVPSDAEWSILRDFLGGENTAGSKLKESGIAHWKSPNDQADNSSGFTALPGSWRGLGGYFYYSVGDASIWWSSTLSNNPTYPWIYSMWGQPTVFQRSTDPYFPLYAGVSVRCVKD